MTAAQQELVEYMAARRCRPAESQDGFDLGRMVKPVCVAAVLVAGSLALLTMFSATTPRANATFQGPTPVAAPVVAPAKLTMSEYVSLQEGMDLGEVFLTLGVDVDYQEVSTIGPLQTFRFIDGQRLIVVTLDSGRLAAKLQRGL